MEELPRTGLGEKGRLISIIAALLIVGVALTSWLAYGAARDSARASLEEHSLPTAADYLQSALQKHLVEPVFVSSMMANDTFLHDWVSKGETETASVLRYLAEIRKRYGVFTSFFVSDRTGNYYQSEGILKKVTRDDPRDAWYWRVRGMSAPYEVNIDLDMAHGDALTIFINYKVIDTNGSYLGAAGVGIAVESMNKVVEKLWKDHNISAYFVSAEGKILVGAPIGLSYGQGADVHVSDDPALASLGAKAIAEGGGAFRYKRGGERRILFVRPMPEYGWYLFMEHAEGGLIGSVSKALALNLLVFALVLGGLIAAAVWTVDRFQTRLERTASYDMLTGALNRMAFGVLCEHAVKEARRTGVPLSVAIFDIDGFKRVNDEKGHAKGDEVLKLVVAGGRSGLRQSDPLCRWGGEEFVALLASCDSVGALAAAEKFRASASALCANESSERITLSAGVATLKQDENFHTLVCRADEALLAAKKAGKDRTIASGG